MQDYMDLNLKPILQRDLRLHLNRKLMFASNVRPSSARSVSQIRDIIASKSKHDVNELYLLIHIRRCGHSICNKDSIIRKEGKKGDELRLCEPCNTLTTPRKSLREVVVFRKWNCVHYYKIVEQGRRFYKTLIFSSDWRSTLYDMPPVVPVDTPCDISERYATAAG